jgi:hypothetical protein
MYVCMYVYTYVRMYICVCAHTHKFCFLYDSRIKTNTFENNIGRIFSKRHAVVSLGSRTRFVILNAYVHILYVLNYLGMISRVHCHHVCCTELVYKRTCRLMVYLCTIYHTHSSNDSLCIAVKPEAKEIFASPPFWY